MHAPPAPDGRPRRRQTWGFIPFAFAKLVLGLLDPLESKLRALYRLVCLLLLPGLSDHFPVRAALRRQALGPGLGCPRPGTLLSAPAVVTQSARCVRQHTA